MKKLLIIGATHGDEPIGQLVMELLSNQGYGKYFDTLIANPLALEKKRRFVDCDLNRSYPGNMLSEKYEERIAAENLALASKYDYIIDLHQASCGNRDFIIIPRSEITSDFPLDWLNMETILLWPDPKGPLGDVLPNCVELEFGMIGRELAEAAKKGAEIVAKFIESMNGAKAESPVPKDRYVVEGLIKTIEWPADQSLPTDFEEAEINGNSFFPLLVGQYADLGVLCYRAKKI